MDGLTEDRARWVVVITGSGDKAFSAGMDLKAFSSGEGGDIMGRAAASPASPSASSPSRSSPRSTGPPWPAASRSSSGDLVVAAEHATFGIPEAKRG